MFRLDLLPAAHGDALWLEYGDGASRHRVLIDGGPGHTYHHLYDRVTSLPRADRHFELFVITHIDADHIEGAIRLLHDVEPLGVTFGEIWFNGREQIAHVSPRGAMLGVLQGEYVSMLLTELAARTGKDVLNTSIGPYIGVPDAGPLPTVTLAGGLQLTLLSPDLERLRKLLIEWDSVLEEEGFESGGDDDLHAKMSGNKRLRGMAGEDPEIFDPEAEESDDADDAPTGRPTRGPLLGGRSLASDDSVANGSSIAFLAEHPDGSALLVGDAFAPVLEKSIKRHLDATGAPRLTVDAFKLPHHGSAANLSEELLDLISTKHYLISTSGARFNHPHELAIETIRERHRGGKPRFHFNHRSDSTAPWSSKEDQVERGYVAHFPEGIGFDPERH